MYCLTMHRPYHHGDLREAVLGRAMVKIETDGLAALSLRDLARECGVSPSAPQKHFATKQDLLTALVVRGYDELAETLSDAKIDGPIDKALVKFGQAYMAYVVEHPALLQLMYSIRFDEGTHGVAQAAATRAEESIREVLDRARARGEIVGNRKAVTAFVRVVLRGLASSVSSGALDASDHAVVRQVVNAALSGLRPR
jgi:AcrR family transcriptional regulator